MTSPPPLSSAFTPPAAITDSIRQSTLHLARARQIPDNVLALQRREQQLQVHLQALLDAQSAGLTNGLGAGAAPSDAASTGSSTPTAASLRSTSRDGRSRSRHAPKHISLRSARKGIWATMRELAALKEEETRVLEVDTASNDVVVARLRGWETKRSGLQDAIEQIEGSRDERRKEEMKTQADKLSREIEETERRLRQMKMRHQHLIDEIEAGENQVLSRLASYRNSLNMVDAEVKEFLKRPPSGVEGLKKGEIEYLGLPPNRRTLGMACETWERRHIALEQDQDHAAMERDALKSGAKLWKDVVEDVTEFENRLRRGLGIMTSRNLDGGSADDIRSLLNLMEETLQKLEERSQLAEERDWRLLICCIGAELEAFRQGKDILQEALAAAAPESELEEMKDVSLDTRDGRDRDSSSEEPEESLFQSAIFKGKGKAPSREPIELPNDDDPDPELLVSHQDPDTD